MSHQITKIVNSWRMSSILFSVLKFSYRTMYPRWQSPIWAGMPMTAYICWIHILWMNSKEAFEIHSTGVPSPTSLVWFYLHQFCGYGKNEKVKIDITTKHKKISANLGSKCGLYLLLRATRIRFRGFSPFHMCHSAVCLPFPICGTGGPCHVYDPTHDPYQ